MGLGSFGCAASPVTVEAPRAASGESAPVRRPDAVVIEPAPARLSARARADAYGVVALRQPIADEAVVALVRAFLDAWQHESLDAMGDLLAPDASAIDAHGHGRAALVDSFRQRLQAHEYGRLAGLDLVQPERIERSTYDDFDAPGARVRPPEMRRDDLYVRVPLEVTHSGGERYFGDALLFVLRADGGKLRIAAYGEAEEK
jgi:hypothetical protein